MGSKIEVYRRRLIISTGIVNNFKMSRVKNELFGHFCCFCSKAILYYGTCLGGCLKKENVT